MSKQVISHYRGEIKGSITRAFLKLKMKQKVQTTSGQPVLEGNPDYQCFKDQLPFLDLSVESMDAVQVEIHGLGPFNWLGKRMTTRKVVENVR